MNLRERMEEKGASPVQIKSKTVEIIEDIMAEDAGLIPVAANDRAKEIEKALQRNDRDVRNLNYELSKIKDTTASLRSEMQEVIDTAQAFVDSNNGKRVENKKLKDAILTYNHLLVISKEVFGEDKMTENVIMQIIESSSYAFWRAIMGGKFEDDDDTQTGKKAKSLGWR